MLGVEYITLQHSLIRKVANLKHVIQNKNESSSRVEMKKTVRP